MNTIEQLNRPAFPHDVSDKFDAHLNDHGRLNLLAVGLRIAPHTEALALVDAFMSDNAAGPPLPSLVGVMEDAEWHSWAASPVECKAYTLAHYNAMRPEQQAAFLDFVATGKRVAA